MLKQKLNSLRADSIGHSILTFLVWLICTNGLILFVDKVYASPFALMTGFGFIYPVGACVLFFRLGKRHGVVWQFAAAVILAAVCEYVFYRTYRIIVPNMLVMTALALLFGCGVGSVFADKDAIAAERLERKLRRTGDDKPYTSIIDDDNSKNNKQ